MCDYQIVGIGERGERLSVVRCDGNSCLRKIVWGDGDKKGLGMAGAYNKLGESPAVSHLIEGDCNPSSMESLVSESVAELDRGSQALASLASEMIASIEEDIDCLKRDLGL